MTNNANTKNEAINIHKENDVLCVRSALRAFAAVLDTLESAHADVDKYITHDQVDRVDLFEKYVIRILTYLCENANNDIDNKTQLKITRERLPTRYSRYRIYEAIGTHRFNNQRTNTELADLIYAALDVNLLNQELDKQKSTIQNSGYAEAADEIAQFLGLSHTRYDEVDLLRSKGKVGLPVSIYNSRHDRTRRLYRQIQFTKTVELETGVTGYADALTSAFNEEDTLPGYDDRVASRTTVRSDNCEIIFYKEKMNIFFDPQFFESLWSFLTEYCSKPLTTVK